MRRDRIIRIYDPGISVEGKAKDSSDIPRKNPQGKATNRAY